MATYYEVLYPLRQYPDMSAVLWRGDDHQEAEKELAKWISEGYAGSFIRKTQTNTEVIDYRELNLIKEVEIDINTLIDAHNEGKLIFRPHRGGYAESMSEAFVVSDLSQLEAQGLPLSKLRHIQSRAYGCDDRDSPLWLDTHIVTAIWDNEKRCPIGFTNRSIDILQQQAEE